MERIPPLARTEHPELEEYYKVWSKRLGYLPNTVLTLSRKPNIVMALAKLSEAVHNDCSLPPPVREAGRGRKVEARLPRTRERIQVTLGTAF